MTRSRQYVGLAMPISWEPSEFDSVYTVSGSLLVNTASGDRVIGYPKPVSVSASNQIEAKTKVKMMLLSRHGLKDVSVTKDSLRATLKQD